MTAELERKVNGTMIQKAKRTYAAEIEGKTAVVFVGDQGAEVGFPAVGLSAVFENAKRLAMAYDSQHNRGSEEWKFVLYAHPSSWSVGTTDDGKVALMIDRGRPTEQTLTLSWDHAAELGKRLVDLAASGPSIRGASN
jgi:hypothetical protein